MADDLQNYKLQLQQVEAALQTDPENDELLKLRSDLQEVITLTRDLIQTQLEEKHKSSYVEPSSTKKASSNYFDDIEAALLEAEKLVSAAKTWRIGDKCQAKWKEDRQYYDATIEDITSKGEVKVIFDAYQNRSTTHVHELRERTTRNEVFPSNKRHRPNQKEYLKKRKQKKQQRFKDLEEERESDKNKWLNFSTKNQKKTGLKAKSIFASPDNVSGRVGVGTCGTAGKGMTDFTIGEKYRKGL
ncbi:survival of motor neuron-related-splicing factor 30 [Drosophila elegans]|uniref:survival of motor neuron-related-splicing factor 30 n=1 Tax=Drosophila elegans TaxID=30023 RepID=UPI0007E757C0|nr:survival of motor neuron-related-splicing factor 30 [Drosophila elegans]